MQRPSTVLVVDDTAENRALAEATLEDEGYRVLLATNGPEALEILAREPIDCVLLDVRMPGMDGFTVCKRIHELPEDRRDVPVIFLTAYRDLETFERALEAGADDFLTKPTRPAELVVRVRTALELRRTSAELRELYATVRRQRDDLLRVQLQKERLMAFVVHDLKNPVNAMDLHAQVLLRDRSLSEGSRDSAQRIRDEARALLRLLLTLLDVSKAEEGKLEAQRRPVELGSILRGVAKTLSSRAEASEVRIALELGEATVNVDRELLERVGANLVENAIRHSPRGAEVRVEAAVRECGGLELRVRDRGAGVPPEMRERIFDPFVQVESGGTASRSGRGLGLTFCRLAVEAHGGTIALEESEPGAVFVVRIPDVR